MPARALIEVVVGNHPFAPPLSAPTALHADPFHLATWSACAMPATSFASVPTYTSVPTAVRPRTKRGDRAAARSGARAHRLPAAPGGQVGDVVGGGDVLQVGEPSARVERAVAVGRQRVHRAGEGVGRIDDRGARGAGGQVAGEQVVGGRDARAVLELAADVERLADDLQAGHVPVERRPGRVAERLPARAVPDREEVGVRVAPRVLEAAAGVDLAGGHGDGGDAAVGDLRRRRADRAPAAAVPRRDAIRVGDAARVGELAAHVERARRHRQRGGDEVQRVGPGRAPVPEVVPAAGAGGRRQRGERADDHGGECEGAEDAALAGRAGLPIRMAPSFSPPYAEPLGSGAACRPGDEARRARQ